ncbi:MAG: diguanylate cyclase [Georgfuchsia sp.]
MSQQDIVLREKFLFILEWLLAVANRYPTRIQFNIVHINFANSRLLGDTYGAQEAVHKLDEVLHSLINGFRKTDLVARDGTDFWALFPYTSSDEKLAIKIKYIIHIASKHGLQIVGRDISIFSMPFAAQKLDENCSAKDILLYFKKNRITLATYKVMLPPSKEVDAQLSAAA